MKTPFKKIQEMFSERRKMAIFQNTLKKAAYAGSPFLKHFFGQRINRSLMIMLQIISVFTTLAGAKYYLSGINQLAPFLFAIAIQLGLLYHASSYADIESKKLPHLFLLALFTTISIAFSYTGMAIVSFPPEQKYEETYQKYCSEAKSVVDKLLASNSTTEEIDSKLTDFLQEINNCLSKADIKLNGIDTNIDENNKFAQKDKTSTTNTTKNPVTGESSTIVITTTGDAGVIALKDNSMLSVSQTEISSAKTNLQTAYNSITLDNLRQYIHEDLDAITKSNITTKIANLINCYNTLNKLIGETSTYPDDYIRNLEKQYDNAMKISEISTQTSDNTPSDTNEKAVTEVNNWKTFFNKMLSNKSSASTALETLNSLKTTIDNNYQELKQATLLVGADVSVLSDLEKAKEEMNNYGDPNVQVINYLFEREYRNSVLGIFILAVLVDGLTFLLGIVGRKKNLSLLDPGTNKELIDNEEQLFSIIFVSLMGQKMPNELNIKNQENFETACIEYVNKIKDCIQAFLSEFKNSPWTSQWGYGLYADYKALTQCDGAVSIISILHQLGYLEFLSKEDFQLLKDKFNGKDISEDFNTKTQVSDDNFICILRYRVEMYLHKNTAEISTMFIDTAFIEEVI